MCLFNGVIIDRGEKIVCRYGTPHGDGIVGDCGGG